MKNKSKSKAMIIVGRKGSGHERVAQECARRGFGENVRTAAPQGAMILKKELKGRFSPSVIYITASLDPREDSLIRSERAKDAREPEYGFEGFENKADYVFSFCREEDLGRICSAIEFLCKKGLS